MKIKNIFTFVFKERESCFTRYLLTTISMLFGNHPDHPHIEPEKPTDQKNFEYGHFSRRVSQSSLTHFVPVFQ